MTYNVFGGTLSLAQSINHRNIADFSTVHPEASSDCQHIAIL